MNISNDEVIPVNDQNYLYTNQKYSENFFKELRKFFVNNQFTDIKIYCKNEVIECHKLVLSSFSSYFCAMFTSNLIETQTNQVTMNEIESPQLLRDIINYAYCGSININVNNVQNLLTLSSLLQITEIVEACSDFMETQLDHVNCINLYYFAAMHNCLKLKQKCKDFIDKNFSQVCLNEDFVNLDVKQVCELLDSDDLNIDNEELIVKIIFKWLLHDFQQRNVHKEDLCKLIRVNLLDKFEEFDLCNFLNQNNLTLESETFLRFFKQFFIEQSNLKFKQRAGMTRAENCFIIIGGNYDLDDGVYVNCINVNTNEKFYVSNHYQDKSKTSKGYFHIENPGVCVTENNRIFVAGGNYVYHEYRMFKRLASGLTERSDHLRDGESFLSKEMYEYDSVSDTWIRRSNMLFAKSNFSLCAVGNNKIYCFGGITLDTDRIDIVECYDIEENKWTYIGSLPTPFISGSVIFHNNLFYICGGRIGVGRINSCFTFNAENKEWNEVASMRIGRFNFGMCAINDKIYVIGGQRYLESQDSLYTREALSSVEVYDIVADQWSIGPSTPYSIYNTGICLVENCLYVCGTTEYRYDDRSMFGYMFTSIFKLDVAIGDWSVIEHDVTDLRTNCRCISAYLNTRKLRKHVNESTESSASKSSTSA